LSRWLVIRFGRPARARPYLAEIAAPRKFDPQKLLPPPWIVKPDRPPDSIGWRMGGEQHFWAVQEIYGSLTPPEQAAHDKVFPAPAEWSVYLQRVRRG
jgi:hypothetical protein